MSDVTTIDDGATTNSWLRTVQALTRELGEDAVRSWVAPATLRPGDDGLLYLVTPTGVARDWIRRNIWSRIGELWATYDPAKRALVLSCRSEFDSRACVPKASVVTTPVMIAAPESATEATRQPNGCLQERFTFSNFVVGPTNEFPHAVAQRVASWSDGHFNPVVFHGSYGVGKTHLLNALAWQAMAAQPARKVIYMNAERFLSAFVRALKERTMPWFKDTLRSADLLLIDDVQFIGGKNSSQEELFHTLAALMEEGRRVVLAADRPVSGLTDLDARLRSYLSAGLVCALEPADRPLRLAVLRRKLAFLKERHGFTGDLAEPVLQFLADRFTDNVRELEGALNTLVMRAAGGIDSLSLDQARSFLGANLKGSERRLTVDEIQKATAEFYNLRKDDLLSQQRARAIARPRQVAMWLAKTMTTRSLPDIGRRFGNRDHTTVIHAVRRIDELRLTDERLARDIEQLQQKLRS